MEKPKLNSSVAVVKLSNTLLEFFKSNTRRQVHLKVQNDLILNIANDLDGNSTIEQLSKKHGVEVEELIELVEYLKSKGLLDLSGPKTDFIGYDKFRRVIHFLNDYATSHEHLSNMWNRLRKSRVLIIGLGAVGTWVACNLVQSGVENLILMDADVVDITNLHRQFGYVETDVGKKKADVLEKRLKEYNSSVEIVKEYSMLDENSLTKFDGTHIDLIINCADKPTVDITSLWVGEYAMKRNIPHIVGGGYNLHLSLIGQTVIPQKTACVMCFQKTLEEENKIDQTMVKKLAVKNRKIGSFGPMCSLIASIVGMEAVKILTECTTPANINRRGEFDIYSMNVTYKTYERREDCEWCGRNGKYRST